ncbi:MAG: PEP-CTERM-box response regulator transcription factor [Deltaproteobacteria bacterium]|nr:PEP-CTERM-box response regulator transcription factor [Deltaproteobacteria bacterium]
MEQLLIVDDNEDIRTQLKWGFMNDYDVLQAADAALALQLFDKHHPRVVMLDLGLPPDADGVEEGINCLVQMLQRNPHSKIIVITGNGERQNALRSIQLGAYDYIQKPIDIDSLRIILTRTFRLSALEEENRNLLSSIAFDRRDMSGIIGQSPRMLEVFATIRKVASCDAPVFITGESGTGKELVARAIHDLSLRSSEQFVPINCGAIPENLLESELFGYEKGAFTGAHARVKGKVEYANKGTLFLDELGELPVGLQVKLLRFLQEKVIQRVGGRENVAADTRIVSATHRDIACALKDGLIREDLYYRIAVISIKLPPLRERGDDITLLANYFLNRFNTQLSKNIRGFSQEALRMLESYEWPGNIRELENRIMRAVIMSDSPVLHLDSLGFSGATKVERQPLLQTAISLKDARDQVEREMISAGLKEAKGNMAKAADLLGVSRPTLYDLVKKHGLSQDH